jgi:hypothetical protein
MAVNVPVAAASLMGLIVTVTATAALPAELFAVMVKVSVVLSGAAPVAAASCRAPAVGV